LTALATAVVNHNYRPVCKKDGSIKVTVCITSRIIKQINADFRGKWLNRENIGKSEAEMIVL